MQILWGLVIVSLDLKLHAARCWCTAPHANWPEGAPGSVAAGAPASQPALRYSTAAAAIIRMV